MSKRNNKKKQEYKKIAKIRIARLFLLAEQNALKGRLHLSDRYVLLARKISMKYLVPIPKKYKRRFCKHCYKYLMPGVNSRVRLCNSKVVYYCSSCKKYMRFPYKKW